MKNRVFFTLLSSLLIYACQQTDVTLTPKEDLNESGLFTWKREKNNAVLDASKILLASEKQKYVMLSDPFILKDKYILNIVLNPIPKEVAITPQASAIPNATTSGTPTTQPTAPLSAANFKLKQVNTASPSPLPTVQTSVQPTTTQVTTTPNPTQVETANPLKSQKELEKYRMWFTYGGLDDISNQQSLKIKIGYAESDDGISWYNASNALEVGAEWDKTNVEAPSIVEDETVAEGSPTRYRMYYAGVDNSIGSDEQINADKGYGIGLAYSADGKTFKKLEAGKSPYQKEGLVLKANEKPSVFSDSTEFVHISDPCVILKDKKYYMWYTSVTHKDSATRVGMSISFATSDDGIKWKKEGVILSPDQEWEKNYLEPSVGRPHVFYNNESKLFEMFYDSLRFSDTKDRELSYGIGYATSKDGRAWTKEKNSLVFKLDKSSTLDKGLVTGGGVLFENNKYNLYYPTVNPDWPNILINRVVGEKKK